MTDAATAIGRAIARALLGDGYAVTICSSAPARIEAAASELLAHGVVQAVPADGPNPADVARLLADHEQRFGRLDVGVNTPGSRSPPR